MFNILVILMLITLLMPCDAIYGEKCELYSSNCDAMEKCRNGRCECNSIISTLTYNAKAVASCELALASHNCSEECKKDQVCDQYFHCSCIDSSEVIISGECVKVTYQNVLEKCYLGNDTAYFCNHENNSFCRNEQCVCFLSYFYNQTSKDCEPKEAYTTFHNISEYKARPEEYCLKSDDCIDGLRCLPEYVCACPLQCKYNRSEQICDCGEVSFEFPTEATFTGIVLGCLSIALWIYLIHRTIKKEMGKEDMNISATVRNSSICELNDISATANAHHPADAPPPYSMTAENKNGSRPPLGFDLNYDSTLSNSGIAPPPYPS